MTSSLPPTLAVTSCSCGRHYSAASWLALPLVGYSLGLEYRNCPCGSTRCLDEQLASELALARLKQLTRPEARAL